MLKNPSCSTETSQHMGQLVISGLFVGSDTLTVSLVQA